MNCQVQERVASACNPLVQLLSHLNLFPHGYNVSQRSLAIIRTWLRAFFYFIFLQRQKRCRAMLQSELLVRVPEPGEHRLSRTRQLDLLLNSLSTFSMRQQPRVGIEQPIAALLLDLMPSITAQGKPASIEMSFFHLTLSPRHFFYSTYRINGV